MNTKIATGIICVVLISAFGNSLTARADGNSAQTSSDYKRKKITLPTLHMREGEIDVKDFKAEATGSSFKDSEGNSGYRGSLELRSSLVMAGDSDEDGSHGILLNPGAKLTVEGKNSNDLSVRQLDLSLGAAYSVQGTFRRDDESLLRNSPLRLRAEALGKELDAQQDIVRQAQSEVENPTQPNKAPTEEEVKQQAERDKYQTESMKRYTDAKADFVIKQGKEILQAKAAELSPKLDAAIAVWDAKKKKMENLQPGSRLYQDLAQELQQSSDDVKKLQEDLYKLGALGKTYERYNNDVYTSTCKKADLAIPCTDPKGKVTIDKINADLVVGTFPEWAAWAKTNDPLSGKFSAIVEKKNSALEREKAKRVAAYAAAQQKLDKLTKDKKAADEALEARRKEIMAGKRAVHTTVDGTFGQVGAEYRDYASLGVKDKAVALEVAQGSIHTTGVINDIVPVGLCAAVNPLRVLVGQAQRPGEDLNTGTTAHVEGQFKVCAEAGIGKQFMIRDTVDVSTDYDKYVIVRNTLGTETLGGRVGVSWTNETENESADGKTVHRNLINATVAY